MGAWDYAHWIQNEKIKNLKKNCRGFPYKRNRRRFSLRYPLSKVSSYLKLKVKYDDVMPINSHVTSEEEKRKLQPQSSNPPKKSKKKKLKKKNFERKSKCHFPKFSKNLSSPIKRVRCRLCQNLDIFCVTNQLTDRLSNKPKPRAAFATKNIDYIVWFLFSYFSTVRFGNKLYLNSCYTL